MYKKVEEEGLLLETILKLFNEQSHKKLKSYLKNNSIFVNGKSITAYNYKVKKNDIIEIRKDYKTHKKCPLKILYEDEYFLVIEKPAHLLTIATTKEKEKTAYHIMRQFIKERNSKDKIFILHRLDKDTSGVVIFVKDERVKELLQNDWNNLIEDREYIAVVPKGIKSYTNYTCYLKEDNNYKVHVTNDKNGKKAITSITVLKENKNYSLIKINIKTGRKNQIRAVLSHLGYPVVGDTKYGSDIKAKRLLLHASKIILTNPKNKKKYTFESKLPREFQKYV
ncbi:RluA family pseudouridine synthase [bacterium]|nr:RluA family pseudouridine synthase [bacterium]